jgi:aconitate hydratase
VSGGEFGIRPSELLVGRTRVQFYRVSDLPGAEGLPASLRIVAENMLRNAGRTGLDLAAIADKVCGRQVGSEIEFFPARVLMHDLSGIPALLDLAALREAMASQNPAAPPVQPQLQADFIVDHSVVAQHSGTAMAFARNAELDLLLNKERYSFLRWAAGSFRGLRLFPPNRGICHQVNLEYLASVVRVEGQLVLPDTVIGTDSHTPMINALGVLGWGVGGIEAEAALLGLPVTMSLPPVVGVRLTGQLPPGTTATDLGLTVNQRLRALGVVGAFVEFTGSGLAGLSLAARATISNMSPEYGSTCAYFPVDEQTLRYLRLTNRSEEQVNVVEAYAKEQGLWSAEWREFEQDVDIDLAEIEPSVAGPSRPDQRIGLAAVPAAAERAMAGPERASSAASDLPRGAVVLAAITSCTNTSNPEVMVGAGLLARRARARGMLAKPWVKTTLAPGSMAVTSYLESAGLLDSLHELGFWQVGYGCTTCMGNSGELLPEVAAAMRQGSLPVAAVLSGNRNFPGRIHPDVSMNFLASPPLVVAYAIAGRVDVDLTRDPLGVDADGAPVYLSELWPSDEEIATVVAGSVRPGQFEAAYADLADSADATAADVSEFGWDDSSTYLRRPPFFDDLGDAPALDDIVCARALVVAGDAVPTDHISPAGAIRADSPAGRYLAESGVAPAQFNSYGSRRGNHEVMVRGTFDNRWLRNALSPDAPGGMTRLLPDGTTTTIFDAAQTYRNRGVPLVVLAGRGYGVGSSRDWAAKGVALLGVRAVLAESFERIHRSNLIGLGVVPLEYLPGESALSLGLDVAAPISVRGLSGDPLPEQVEVTVGGVTFAARIAVITSTERAYLQAGGILRYAARQLAEAGTA